MEYDTEPTLRLQSSGAGVQSTAITLLVALSRLHPFAQFRDLPGVPDTVTEDQHAWLQTLDGAIFSDTGWEPREVYDHLDRLEREVMVPAGIPLHRVSAGNIRNDALDPDKRFASMPLFVKGPDQHVEVVDKYDECPAGCGWLEWLALTAELDLDGLQGMTLDGRTISQPDDCTACGNQGRVVAESHDEVLNDTGMARRQCTSEYKIKPIKRQVRELLGYPHPTPVPKGVYAEQWVGISRDEWHRAKSSDVRYSRNRFPLLDLDMTRADCERLLRANGFGETPKSACIGCPFHGNRQWRDLRDNHPDEWTDAVEFDAAIRQGSAHANAKGMPLRGSMFLHRSLLPLSVAPIDRVTRKDAEHLQGNLLDLAADDDAELAGCSPFGCRSGEADLPWFDPDEDGEPAPAAS